MKQKKSNVLILAGLAVVMLLSILVYAGYTRQQIRSECTQNLLSTYTQAAKTFNMFAERNWNILAEWTVALESFSGDADAEQEWRDYVNEKANWQYSECGLFNEQNDYWTVAGRQGYAPHMQAALTELYAADEPIVTSYISSQGVRKVMFAVQVPPVKMDGVVYTSLSICYDNSVLENLLGGLAYEGQSDCYIVRADGGIVMSTEPKSEIPEQMTNLFDYLEQNAEVREPDFTQMRQSVRAGESGSVTYTFKASSYYLVYQPVGLKDWSIVGIVPANAVEGGMNAVQSNTILLLFSLLAVILFGTYKIVKDAARARQERDEAEKRELQRRKELTDQMFAGMARIVLRFAVCDLDNDTYEHHERGNRLLYPPKGAYHDLLEKISRDYVLMTDGENAKMTQMLAPEHLRSLLKAPEDMLTFEYAARDKSAFLMMNVVPAGWEDGRLTRVMLISQDMGEQHMLRSMANTDALTGLLNKRYFDTVLASLVNRGQAFALFYLDLDRFKPVNDTYGHTMGDRLLQEVAKRLQGCIRTTDYVFRLGGDEFALLLVGAQDSDACRQTADRVCKAVGEPYELDGRSISIGTSCGWACFPEEGADAEEIHILADQRMYQNKQRNHALLDHGL